MNKNVYWQSGYISREDREIIHGHKGAVVWFTGLSASGKSTIAQHLEKLLYEMGCSTYVFDGDNVRHGLCSDLGFSPEDRSENIRRIGEMVSLFVDAGLIALTAFISPIRKDRERIRDLIGPERFFEVYINCPIKVCSERDPKGVYAKAKAGIIKEFTGISSPYEEPEKPICVVRSDQINPADAAKQILSILQDARIIPGRIS